MPRIYLDHNATTPPHPEVRRAMAEALDCFGNPSSIHTEGRRAREAVEHARDRVAALIGADGSEIVFTSGGTEACHLGTWGFDGPVVSTRLEHPAVLGAIEGRGRFVAVGADGRVDPDQVARALPGAALCSLQWVNHEVGNVNPIGELVRRCRDAGVAMHTDAVQAAGKIAIDVGEVEVDLLSISAHKVFGPKGVGALFVRRGREPRALLRGGHQEKGRRAGTENVVGIVGMGVACDLARRELDQRSARVSRLSRRLEDALVSLGADIHGDRGQRAPGTVNAAFAEVPGDALVQALDLEGISASTGAACASGSIAPSPVLLAMGLFEARARCAVRFSLGPDNTTEEVDRVAAVLPALIERIRRHEGRSR